MTRRKWLAAGVLACWLGGLGLLAHRELFPSEERRMELAALLVEPISYYYAVEENGRHVGYATSQVDTSLLGITLRYSVVTLKPVEADDDAATWQFRAQLSRRMRLNDFTLESGPPARRRVIAARSLGDTALEIGSRSSRRWRPDTVQFARNAVTAEVAPLLIALGRNLESGDTRRMLLFDAATKSLEQVELRIEAESLFVVSDSAHLDPQTSRYVDAHSDTVRAWMSSIPGTGGGAVWFDKSGRIVLHELSSGLTLRRTAFELAFENLRLLPERDEQPPVSASLPRRHP